MTQIATREQARGQGNGNSLAVPAAGGGAPAPAFNIQEIWSMAEWVADSGLFGGCKTPQQAFTLMLICQSEGLHPIQAMRRYHIIPSADGPRATMRADAMQAEFQARGGLIEMVRCDAEEARAIFSHPKYQPRPVERAITYKECTDAGITRGREGEKKNWRESRADMLWSRLVTKNIRKLYPGIVAGIYSPDEVEDMDTPVLTAATVARLDAPVPSAPRPAAEDPPVVGFEGAGFDGRAYNRVAGDAVAFKNAEIRAAWELALGVPPDAPPPPLLSVHDLHRWLLNAAIQLGHAEGPLPSKMTDAIKKLDAVYRAERAWMRGEIMGWIRQEDEALEAVLEEAVAARDIVRDPPGADEDDDGPGADEAREGEAGEKWEEGRE